MSSTSISSIAYMEQLIDRCLKASPSWYMSDIHNNETNHHDSYYYEINRSNSFNPTTCGQVMSDCGRGSQSTAYSASGSFVSGIRRSGCRVPF